METIVGLSCGDLEKSQPSPSLRLLWLALESRVEEASSLTWLGQSNSSVSCCQGRQDVTSSRWASDQWTPSLGKDVGPGQDGERWLMDGPGSCDGWAGRSCHLSWEVSDFESGRREGMGSWESGGGAARRSRAGEVRARVPRLGREQEEVFLTELELPALDQRMLTVRQALSSVSRGNESQILPHPHSHSEWHRLGIIFLSSSPWALLPPPWHL